MKKLISLVCLCALLCGLLCACGGSSPKKTFYIVEQYGTAYAPIALMRQLGTLEHRLPAGTTVEWRVLNNTTAIREAMLAGEADIGCMGIPPFLIGLDDGMAWRICSGVSSIPMGLVSRDASITSLADIDADERIALPQPGSAQHILLAMAAQKQLGDAAHFDNQLVAMNHPDGYTAMLSGTDVNLHFTTTPYLGQELAAGMHLVLTDEEAIGAPYTGIVAVAREAFAQDEPQLYKAFVEALEEAVAMLQTDPRGCALALAEVYGMDEEALLAELIAEGVRYHTGVGGLSTFSLFMKDTGYIQQEYPAEALVFSGVVVG